MSIKTIEMPGCAGNTRTLVLVVAGTTDRYDPASTQKAKEMARLMHDTMPGEAWKAFVAEVKSLCENDPYKWL